jgi:peptide/nickel transport system ATP-binding protein
MTPATRTATTAPTTPGGRRLLVVDDLTVSYRTTTHERLALDAVDLTVGSGEIVGLVGQSGSGKSTLAAAVLGLLPGNAAQLSGSVRLGEVDLTRLSAQELRRIRGHDVSIVFQDPTVSLNPRLPVGKQMLQVQRAHGPGGRTARRGYYDKALAGLAEVGLPNPRRAFGMYPHEFSGGMRQRVMIAMALLLEPMLIIADEATSALDVTLEAQILELLLRLRETHDASVLFISHNLGVVSQLCDRTTVLHAGRVVEEIAGRVVWSRCRHPYTQSLAASAAHKDARIRRLPTRVPDVDHAASGCHFADQCLHAHDLCRSSTPELYQLEGGSARCFAYAPEAGSQWTAKPAVADWFDPLQDGRPALVETDSATAGLVSVRDLHVSFGAGDQTVRAVDGVDLSIERGEIVAVVGESGSGKTTLAEALVRLVRPTGGSIHVDGQDTATMSPADVHALRRRVQMVFQSAQGSLSPRLQVGSLVTEPYQIFAIPHDQRMRPDDILAQVDLPAELLNSYPSQLSGGQARRVGLARALVCEPELLVADEPTSGLDAAAAASAARLLGDLREAHGLAILLITHDLSLVTNLADRVCVMYFGKIVETGPVSEIVQAPAHPYTKALLSLLLDPDSSAPVGRRKLLAEGEIPNQAAPPSGCRFHPRCPLAQEICAQVEPPLRPVGGSTRSAACHFADSVIEGGHGDL